jgi:hypothetical protein
VAAKVGEDDDLAGRHAHPGVEVRRLATRRIAAHHGEVRPQPFESGCVRTTRRIERDDHVERSGIVPADDVVHPREDIRSRLARGDDDGHRGPRAHRRDSARAHLRRERPHHERVAKPDEGEEERRAQRESGHSVE